VRRILQKRAASAVTYWLRKFGSKRGAPQKQDPLVFHALKIYKERKRLSWSQLAEVINPTLFDEKPSLYKVASAVRRAERKLEARKSQ
jgi:methionyl-tRNA formyltransferase